MPNEPFKIISWFANFQRLFEQLKVAAELQVVLVRLYFGKRTRHLLSRCDLTLSADYVSFKKFFSFVTKCIFG